ncbi:solute carrier family 28 member 3-like isoform X1 [Gigantopelta aegis]|uniref:solute carrier family 28 member 3-like isoform X1 n=1 Tax=Gigantopelta aegis TaxID=1735272 RepID=UPI001B889ECA|nr:solute carrier family 28 member 3-like isoform X1 [Gigantopelta aegis]XP_041368749.1 solute carrier family 28 member 3-like isoform X1 [Gigantopelta aegis]
MEDLKPDPDVAGLAMSTTPESPTSTYADSDPLLSKPPTTESSFQLSQATNSDIERGKDKNNDSKTSENDRNIIYGFVVNVIINIRATMATVCAKNKGPGRVVFKLLLLVTYAIYLGFAFNYEFGDSDSIALLVITCIIGSGWVYSRLKTVFGQRVYNSCVRHGVIWIRSNAVWLKRLLLVLVVALTSIYIMVDVIIPRPRHLMSVVGIVVYVFITFVFSRNPRKVRWRPVIWGLFLQFVLAVLILRTPWGYTSFHWMSDRMLELISFADAGSEFVFGPAYKEHFLAFQVLPVVVFFSSCVTIMHYLRLMQVLTDHMAVIMKYTIGTSVMESIHAAFNVFIGWGEAMMLLRGRIEQMTLAEIHTVMTSSFAVISGSNLAVYVMYGAAPYHLLAASFLSAPAALGISKLCWPDEKVSDDDEDEDFPDTEQEELNAGIIDAATNGAIGVITILAHIIVCILAYVALLTLVNAILVWLGQRVGLDMITLQIICSYLFWPFVFIMGVQSEDCQVSARILGIKLNVNEMVAFSDLGVVIKNRALLNAYNGTWHWTSNGDIALDRTNTTLVGGVMTPHSEMITTYAICGFSDLLSYGILITCLVAVAPSRKKDIMAVVNRAISSGVIACFLAACMAGMIADD